MLTSNEVVVQIQLFQVLVNKMIEKDIVSDEHKLLSYAFSEVINLIETNNFDKARFADLQHLATSAIAQGKIKINITTEEQMPIFLEALHSVDMNIAQLENKQFAIESFVTANFL
jgi:hypothetical protein